MQVIMFTIFAFLMNSECWLRKTSLLVWIWVLGDLGCSNSQISKSDKLSPEGYHISNLYFIFFSLQEILVCGHSLEVNITTNLDFFLSVAQVQLLHQLIVANMTGLEPSNKDTEVTITWFLLDLLHLCQCYNRKTN